MCTASERIRRKNLTEEIVPLDVNLFDVDAWFFIELFIFFMFLLPQHVYQLITVPFGNRGSSIENRNTQEKSPLPTAPFITHSKTIY